MAWIRIDDHFDEHPKLAAAGPLAWALWIAGLAYCNRNLTDGFIPWSTAGSLVSWDYLSPVGPTRIYIGTDEAVFEEGAVTSDYVISLLVDAELWHKEPRGYRIHDFAQYQPTKAVVMAERAKKAAAGSAGGTATATARARALGVAKSQPVPVPVSGPFNGSSSPLYKPDAPTTRRNTVQDNPEYRAMNEAQKAAHPDDWEKG